MNVTEVICPSLIANGDFRAPHQPITLGLPFPKGRLPEFKQLSLLSTGQKPIPCQGDVLARWPDGSIRWLLLDAVLSGSIAPNANMELVQSSEEADGPNCVTQSNPHAITVDTGVLEFRVDSASQNGWFSARCGGQSIFGEGDLRLILSDAKGRECALRFDSIELEKKGNVRVTVRLQGRFLSKPSIRFVMRVCFFAGTGLVRIRLTVHNPQRAKHRGGLWDLGDSGSFLFRDLNVRIAHNTPMHSIMSWTENTDAIPRESDVDRFEIYQDSSGGENWQSRNHVNRFGQVPCRLRGYRVRSAGDEWTGLRASPVVTVRNNAVHVTAAIPEFWQQFPKAIDSADGYLNLRLFPGQFGDLHELQGGEQKTHTLWFHFGREMGVENALDWVHRPMEVRASPDWYAASGVFPEFVPDLGATNGADRFDEYLKPVLEGATSIFAKREIIDEYGWRNYGEFYADHENAYCVGPKPVISHYNNQFDPVLGCILQYVRTSDSRWRELFSPLARHIIDIDIYHTKLDRAAYRGGLFWMTDHYLDAGTSSHRTYSRVNIKPGRSYGGGPGNSHNFTTGLLYFYYLTGDPQAADAVESLADWVQRMDDGRLNILSRIDSGPTGLASQTTDSNYHGPGRGSGLSINSQLDGWLLTGRRRYIEKAEELIRRCIHPEDDIEQNELSNIELRWSYTVFLTTLARYLRLKSEAGENDTMYAYGRAALLHYAKWMSDNERPYFDQRDQMEFPTETWAAQDFRKANVMRLAASYANEPLHSRLIERGNEIADRAWNDLSAFSTRHVTRAIAILLTEGTRDQYFRKQGIPPAPQPIATPNFGRPTKFQSQKSRVIALVKSPTGLTKALLRMVLPFRRTADC